MVDPIHPPLPRPTPSMYLVQFTKRIGRVPQCIIVRVLLLTPHFPQDLKAAFWASQASVTPALPSVSTLDTRKGHNIGYASADQHPISMGAELEEKLGKLGKTGNRRGHISRHRWNATAVFTLGLRSAARLACLSSGSEARYCPIEIRVNYGYAGCQLGKSR